MFPIAKFCLLALATIFSMQGVCRCTDEVLYLGAEPAKAYHFPWLVSVHRESPDHPPEFVCSGSIIHPKWFISSLDCYIRKSQHSGEPLYRQVSELNVYPGNVYATTPSDSAVTKHKYVQPRRVVGIYHYAKPDINSEIKILPQGVDPNLETVPKSPFGISMSVALVQIRFRGSSPMEWSWKTCTLPIPLFSGVQKEVRDKVNETIEVMEKYPYRTTCYVAGWRLEDRRLLQYPVMYIPFDQCRDAYCAYNASSCMAWPVEGVHVCFKSLVYTDLCWRDQGSALYCESFSESILAVLTSAPACGYLGLPGVYTLIDAVAHLYERIIHKPYEPMKDIFKFLPPPKNKLLPAN